MREYDVGMSETTPPLPRVQLWQPILRGNDQEPAIHSHSFLSVLRRAEKMSSQTIEVKERVSFLDHARVTAGIIGLYEVVLSEPVPEKMLRLIEEIKKQERKS